MFKRILFGGWVLLFLLALLVLYNPAASWSRGASTFVWFLSIILVLATLAGGTLLAIRLGRRLLKKSDRSAQQVNPPKRFPPGGSSRTIRLALLVFLGMAVLVGVLLTLIERKVKSSPVYQASVAYARSSPELLRILGQPIGEGWFVLGQLTEYSDGRGRVTLEIPLTGPKGKGTLHVLAAGKAGDWQFSVLKFVPEEHGAPVDLLDKPTANP